jgi:hypothetical protein
MSAVLWTLHQHVTHHHHHHHHHYHCLLLLLLLQGELGELLPGAAADLILVDGDPLQDIGCLAGSSSDGSSNSGGGGSNIPLVIKDGLLAKVRHSSTVLHVN